MNNSTQMVSNEKNIFSAILEKVPENIKDVQIGKLNLIPHFFTLCGKINDDLKTLFLEALKNDDGNDTRETINQYKEMLNRDDISEETKIKYADMIKDMEIQLSKQQTENKKGNTKILGMAIGTSTAIIGISCATAIKLLKK